MQRSGILGNPSLSSGFRWLILALALFDVAPVDLCEIELVAIRIIESDERTGLAFVDNVMWHPIVSLPLAETHTMTALPDASGTEGHYW